MLVTTDYPRLAVLTFAQGVNRTGMSLTVYTMTIIIAHPPTKPESEVMMIARGPKFAISVEIQWPSANGLTSNISVGTFFRQMKRCIVATHSPDGSQEAHDSCPSKISVNDVPTTSCVLFTYPIGHSVPFSKVSQTSCDGFVFGSLMLPTGNQMTNMKMITTFATVPTCVTCQLVCLDSDATDLVSTLLTQPINFVDCIVMKP